VIFLGRSVRAYPPRLESGIGETQSFRTGFPSLEMEHEFCAAAHQTWVTLRSIFMVQGMTPTHISEMETTLRRVHQSSGLRGLATTIKRWSNVTRSILAGEYIDSTNVGFAKASRNCVSKLRHEGANETEISDIVRNPRLKCGIPPFLLFREFYPVLFTRHTLESVKRAGPFANIGRTAPDGDCSVKNESLSKFKNTVTKIWENIFSFFWIGYAFAAIATMCMSFGRSRVQFSSHSSRDYTRSMGGKRSEIIDKIVNDFVHKPLKEIVPEEPTGMLYDITGQIFLDPKDWDPDVLLHEVCYPFIREPDDLMAWSTFGHIILLWSVLDALSMDSLKTLSENMVYPGLGYITPSIRFEGYVRTSVKAIPEEGWKARVITITPLCVAIIGIVLRHLFDQMIYDDPLTRVGITSTVKLYDTMRKMNFGRIGGLSDCAPSLRFACVESVDLTTATDSPDRRVVSSLFEGIYLYLSHRGGSPLEFIRMGLDISLCSRQFEFEDGSFIPHCLHRCGIMMGEGISGTFLNVMSCVLRCISERFARDFEERYYGTTTADADSFISDTREDIQTFLDEAGGQMSYNPHSSQSGDDVVIFDNMGKGNLSKFLIVLYRIMSFIPSASTFYSSEYFGTFTEEMCVSTHDSNGWTFVDCLKPRLFRPISDSGIAGILSHIRQISSTLRYKKTDFDLVDRVCSAVDQMIESVPELRDRLGRYGLPVGLPDWMGGIDHPCQHEPGHFATLSDQIKGMLRYLETCTDEQMFLVKYSFVDGNDVKDSSTEVLKRAYALYQLLDGSHGLSPAEAEGVHCMWTPEEIFPRGDLSFIVWKRIVDEIAEYSGLVTFGKLVSQLTAGFNFLDQCDGKECTSVHPLIQRRNRFQKILSFVPDTGLGSEFSEGTLQAALRRYKEFGGNYFDPSSVIDLLDITSLPTYAIRFHTLV